MSPTSSAEISILQFGGIRSHCVQVLDLTPSFLDCLFRMSLHCYFQSPTTNKHVAGIDGKNAEEQYPATPRTTVEQSTSAWVSLSELVSSTLLHRACLEVGLLVLIKLGFFGDV